MLRKVILKMQKFYFTRTLQYDKENLVALVNLGNVMYKLKAYDSAERRYKKSIAIESAKCWYFS